MSEAELHHFQPDAGVPNSRLPLLFWQGRLPAEARSGDRAQALFRHNGWQGTWVYTVFPYWHFHTPGHEVLACVSGRARLGFGGEHGLKADVAVGDVVIIPAGVGHRRYDASADFQMAGGYPPDQEGNIVRPGEIEDEQIASEIAAVRLPERDPVSGLQDGVVEIWSRAG